MGALTAYLAPWVLVSAFTSQTPVGSDALYRYVQKPDPAYAWKISKTVEGNPSKTLIVHLTSQTWRNADEVDRPVWEHWLVIIKPEKPVSNKAFLLIGGGETIAPCRRERKQRRNRLRKRRTRW